MLVSLPGLCVSQASEDLSAPRKFSSAPAKLLPSGQTAEPPLLFGR